MRKVLLVLMIFILVWSPVYAQEDKSISEARKDNIIELLNYRYKGGYYSFERKFTKNVEYPEMALYNCAMGVALVKVEIDCEGNIADVRIKTPLGYGIDQQISEFINSTEGEWNKCKDDKYTKFELPIQFLVEGVETNTGDALLVKEGKAKGMLCNPDEFYIKRINKYFEKKKWKRVIPYLDLMIRRDPYNTEYFEMKKIAVNGGEKNN